MSDSQDDGSTDWADYQEPPTFDPDYNPPDEPPPPRQKLIRANPPVVPFPKPNGRPAPPVISKVERYYAFRERVSALPPLFWLVENLLPSEGIVLFHGRPRSMKTLCMMETAFKLAAGVHPFNSSCFRVNAPAKIVYVTEEDPERLVNARFSWIEAGTSNPPEDGFLYLMIRKGLSLDDKDDLAALLSAIQKTEAQALFLEPMRSLTGVAEKTSSEFKPILDWMRLVQRETPCKTFVLGHHWRKPAKDQRAGEDNTPRSEKISGGALFSISDCLLAFEKKKWNRTLVIPEDYKLSSDPESFEVTWDSDVQKDETGVPRFGSWIRANALLKSEMQADDEADREKLLKWLARNPWATAPEAEAGAKSRKGSGIRIFARLHQEGLLSLATGAEAVKHGRSQNARLYALPPTTPEPPRG